MNFYIIGVICFHLHSQGQLLCKAPVLECQKGIFATQFREVVLQPAQEAGDNRKRRRLILEVVA